MWRKSFAPLGQQLFRIQPSAPQRYRKQDEHAPAKHLPKLVIAPLPVLRNKLRQQRRTMRRCQLLVQALGIAVTMLEKIPSRDAEKDNRQNEGNSCNPLAHALSPLGQQSSTKSPMEIQQKMH